MEEQFSERLAVKPSTHKKLVLRCKKLKTKIQLFVDDAILAACKEPNEPKKAGK